MLLVKAGLQASFSASAARPAELRQSAHFIRTFLISAFP